MYSMVKILVYPNGDRQETNNKLSINNYVNINGYPLYFPLSTTKMIVYRVFKITRDNDRREEREYYHLELISRPELERLNVM